MIGTGRQNIKASPSSEEKTLPNGDGKLLRPIQANIGSSHSQRQLENLHRSISTPPLTLPHRVSTRALISPQSSVYNQPGLQPQNAHLRSQRTQRANVSLQPSTSSAGSMHGVNQQLLYDSVFQSLPSVRGRPPSSHTRSQDIFGSSTSQPMLMSNAVDMMLASKQKNASDASGDTLDMALKLSPISSNTHSPSHEVIYLSPSTSAPHALHPSAVHVTSQSSMVPGVAIGSGVLSSRSVAMPSVPPLSILDSVATTIGSADDVAFERELARLSLYHSQIDRISQLVGTQTSFVRLVSVLAQQVALLVSADRVRVLTVSPKHGLSMISVGAAQHHLGFTGLSGVCARTRRVIHMVNPCRDPQYDSLVDSIPHEGGGMATVGSLMVVPVECDIVSAQTGEVSREVIALIQCVRLPVAATTMIPSTNSTNTNRSTSNRSSSTSEGVPILDIAYLPFASKDVHAVYRIANNVGNTMQHLKHIDQARALYSASLEWHQRFASVLRVANTLLSENYLDKVVAMIVSQVPELLDADRCTLFFTDREHQELIATKGASHGRPKTFISWIFGQSNAPELPFPPGQTELRFPMSRGLAGYVALTGETLNVQDAHSDDRFNPQVDKDTGYKTRNVLCVPMCDDNRSVIGVVQAINKNPIYPCFDEEDEAILHTFAAQASLAVRNSLLFGKTKKAWQQSDALLEVTKALSSELNMEVLLRIIVTKVQKLIRAERCTVFIVDREQNQLYTSHDMTYSIGQSVAPHSERSSVMRIPMDRGIAGTVASTLSTVNIVDVTTDTRYSQGVDQIAGFHTRTVLCMPISVPHKPEAVGVIQCMNKMTPDISEDQAHYNAKYGSIDHSSDSKLVFDHEDEKMLAAFCVQAAVAIENSRLFTETEKALNHALLERRNIKLYMSVTKQLVSGTHMKMLVQQLRMQCTHLLKADDCALYIVDPTSQEMWLPTEDDTISLEARSRRFKMGQGIVGACAQSGLLVSVSNNAFHDPRFDAYVDQLGDLPPHSVLASPVKADGSAFGSEFQNVVIGVIVVTDQLDRGGFADQEEQLLRVFGAQAAVSLLHKMQLENLVMQEFKEQDKGAAHYLQQERGMKIATADIENFFFTLHDIKLIDSIGAGSYGEVYKAMLRGQVVAVKKLHAKSLKSEQVEAFCQEASLMCQLKNPNIVGFVGAVTDPANLCIITEYCARGSLADILLNPNVKISFTHKLTCALAAAQGMLYLHQSNPIILHRDLKSDNLLVDENWTIKVADFGLTRFLSTDKKAMTQVGTPMWMAPEIIMGMKYTEKADVYAFGIILWELLSRLEPYEDKEPMQIVVEVVKEGLRPVMLPDFAHSPLVSLMVDCWDQEPEERPSFDVVVERLKGLVKKYEHLNVDDYGMPRKGR